MANDRPYDYPNNYDRDDGYGRDHGRDDRNFRGGGTGYGGGRDYRGRESYGAGNRDYYGGSHDGNLGGSYQQQRSGRGGSDYRGSYASDGHRWTDADDRHADVGRDSGRNRNYGRPPQGYEYQDRGFIARAGDEVRSWFGDEDAERRRDYDQRYDERFGGGPGANTAYGRDSDYHSWRRSQIDALDRDYHEYRQENARKFENDFGNWRSNRQTQRASLGQVKEQMDVVGSDGGHVGTVDKVRGDRIILTRTDSDAGGRHHSIPSSWLRTVDDKVTISKSADEAHKHWRDEDTSGAMFGEQDRATGRDPDGGDRDGGVNLNRSFSGTY